MSLLHRLFTPRREMQVEVNERARQVFFDQRVHHAKSGGGVLIYVSLFERMAAIIADEAVIEKVGMTEIENWCRQLTARLRQEDLAGAMEYTISIVGEKLSTVMPRAAGDVNELPDALVVMD